MERLESAQRFGIYRNNIIVSLIDALADTFEVTCRNWSVKSFSGHGPLYVPARIRRIRGSWPLRRLIPRVHREISGQPHAFPIWLDVARLSPRVIAHHARRTCRVLVPMRSPLPFRTTRPWEHWA